jgi:2-polyprenyl-3-methyl-5-hydroxy-6-metoxy-1,4-benzoquinol methylase
VHYGWYGEARLDPDVAERDLEHVVSLKAEGRTALGWSPRLRRRFGYYTPHEWYEAVVYRLVGPKTDWLDVGCGREVCLFNYPLAQMLAARCRNLTGVDPSDNIDENALVHEKVKSLIEDYRPNRDFDLITLSMVAEHITNPTAAVQSLARLARPGGRVVIYTVNKWSPATLLSAATPLSFHYWTKKLFWDVGEKDTFPTVYRMNTRRALRNLFGQAGFAEEKFLRLDDCRTLTMWRWTSAMELAVWKVIHAVGLHYPENCLLGIYRKPA